MTRKMSVEEEKRILLGLLQKHVQNLQVQMEHKSWQHLIPGTLRTIASDATYMCRLYEEKGNGAK